MQIDAAILPDLIADAVRKALAERADAGRFMSAKEAAEMLGIGLDAFRDLVKAGKIRFAIVGARRKFTSLDLDEYRRQAREAAAACPSTNRKSHRSTPTASTSKVFDITARLAQRATKKQKP